LTAADAAPNAFNNLHKVKILTSLASTPNSCGDGRIRPSRDGEAERPRSRMQAAPTQPQMPPRSALRSTLIETERTT